MIESTRQTNIDMNANSLDSFRSQINNNDKDDILTKFRNYQI